jgi:hypothetical protein
MPSLDSLTRPLRSPSPAAEEPDGFRLPPALGFPAAAAAAAAAGLVVVLGIAVSTWLLGNGDGSSGQAVRVGALVWLAAHGAAPVIDGVQVSLVPLLLPVLPALGLIAAGSWATRRRWQPAASSAASSAGTSAAESATTQALRMSAGVAAGAATYATVIGLVGWATGLAAPEGGASADTLRGMGVALVGAALALSVGVARARGGWPAALRARPAVAAVLRGAAMGAVVWLGGAIVVASASLLWHADQVWALGAEVSSSRGQGFALTALCVATMPNAVLWVAAYLVGPGFAAGTATFVAPGSVVLGALPVYPLFGALPAPGDAPDWTTSLMVIPVLAGVLAGVVAARGLPSGGWFRLAMTGAAAGGLAGVAVGLAMSLSGGSIGPNRMAETGPVTAAVVMGVVTLAVAGCAGGVAVGALPAVSLPSWLRQRWWAPSTTPSTTATTTAATTRWLARWRRRP